MRRSRFSDKQIIGILNEHHAREIIEDWRIDYNLNRPHMTLDGLTPAEYAIWSQMDHNVNRANL